MDKKKSKQDTEGVPVPRYSKLHRVAALGIVGFIVAVVLVAIAISGTSIRLASQSNTTSAGVCEVSPTGYYVCAPSEAPGGGSLLRVNASQAVYSDGSVFDQRSGKFK